MVGSSVYNLPIRLELLGLVKSRVTVVPSLAVG